MYHMSASARRFAARLESGGAGLDTRVGGRAQRTRRGDRHEHSSRRWLEFSMSKNLAELLKNPTSKQTNGPGTISASDLAQRGACFDLHKQTRFVFWRPDQNMKLGIGFVYQESEMQIVCMLSSSKRLCFSIFHFFFS